MPWPYAVVITVVREGEAEPFDVSIVRDTIKLTVVKTRIEGKSVVLRVSTFNDETFDTLKSELDKAVAEAGGIGTAALFEKTAVPGPTR